MVGKFSIYQYIVLISQVSNLYLLSVENEIRDGHSFNLCAYELQF